MSGPSPQETVERALAAAKPGDCVVIAEETSTANLRWAGNTLTTNGELAGARHAVGGERVARPAQVRGGGLLGDHHAVAGLGRGQRALDGFLRGRPAHDFPSSAVLSIRTPRSRTAGQPWLTGATWPGWPLPQLNAPPST